MQRVVAKAVLLSCPPQAGADEVATPARPLTTTGQCFPSQPRAGAGASRRARAGPGVPALPENPRHGRSPQSKGAGLGVQGGKPRKELTQPCREGRPGQGRIRVLPTPLARCHLTRPPREAGNCCLPCD
ncbi:hypothetical protein P7K49_001827 [Saguinus oedipus]|uniref:Secreted protein n=1 Tax=Saguinus oedipus TaxID=9490 RepID=A0ABQ9WGJ7_SAGOE|nr:hypothetical protein P7K49_001827 [Saguinus oedipus]